MTAGPGGRQGPAGHPSGVARAEAGGQVRSLAFVLGTSAGGTGRHVAMLAQAYASRGMTVSVYGPGATGRRFFAAEAGGQAGGRAGPGDEWPGGGPPRFAAVEIADRPRPARDAAAVLRLRRLLARSAPDVVHAHGLRAAALSSLALSLTRQRSALVVTVHNAPVAGGVKGAVYGVLERIVSRRADAVACVSEDLTARMRRLGARDGGRALVPAPPAAPPSPAEVRAVREELGGPGRPVVLAAGRLAPQKGFGVLLDAAAHWQHRDPPPLLVIAGDGPLAGPLRARSRAAGLDVRFLGHRPDIPALLAAADVFVVASEWEGQPLTVQEALRAGRPVAAFRVGGIPDLTGEDGALLVPPGDAGALAGAVVSVLEEPALADKLRAAAVARAAALPSGDDAAGAALSLYQRVLAPRV